MWSASMRTLSPPARRTSQPSMVGRAAATPKRTWPPISVTIWADEYSPKWTGATGDAKPMVLQRKERAA